MVQISKFNPFTLIAVGLISLTTISSPFTSIFGKRYFPEKDYNCCKQEHLIFYHYYEVKVFWVSLYDGFTKETVNKPSLAGCNILCRE